MSGSLSVWMPSLARTTTSPGSSARGRCERSMRSISAPVSAERRKCRRGSALASSQVIRPAAASLSISGASEWSSFNSTISPWRSRNSGLSPTLTHSTPGRPEDGADQRAAHAVERRVLLHALADRCIGELERVVEARRHVAGGRHIGVEKDLARRRACQARHRHARPCRRPAPPSAPRRAGRGGLSSAPPARTIAASSW